MDIIQNDLNSIDQKKEWMVVIIIVDWKKRKDYWSGSELQAIRRFHTGYD